jgi:hydroxysqualene synthase
MMDAQAWRSGKTHRDENFPVARLVHPRHRETILAFYDFVRAADDIADHAELRPDAKLAALDGLEATLVGRDDEQPVGVRLRQALAARGLTDKHARDLLAAFRQDVTKLRYADWDELIGYCALSAMPVGRFVLDAHGESPGTWRASDPLCAALQIINHLQDCGEDYRHLDRVYIPLDALEQAGAKASDLGAARSVPALRSCIAGLAAKTGDLVAQGRDLPAVTRDLRLGLECGVIVEVAGRLVRTLRARDPLSERVHFGKADFLRIALIGAASGALSRIRRSPRAAPLGGRRA